MTIVPAAAFTFVSVCADITSVSEPDIMTLPVEPLLIAWPAVAETVPPLILTVPVPVLLIALLSTMLTVFAILAWLFMETSFAKTIVP
jgi:hypothetical protein